MKMLLPMSKVWQIFGDVPGKQNVLGITAIHHPLGNVDAGASDVGTPTHIHYSTHRAAVHARAQVELRMLPGRATDLQGALHRRFRAVVKHQRHSVAGWDTDQP